MFLFHTGSIKREPVALTVSANDKFLFHTGSIKSDKQLRIACG